MRPFPRIFIEGPKLGDKVAAVAQPIAKAIDSVLGTKLQDCQPCKDRQAALNKIGNPGNPV